MHLTHATPLRVRWNMWGELGEGSLIKMKVANLEFKQLVLLKLSKSRALSTTKQNYKNPQSYHFHTYTRHTEKLILTDDEEYNNNTKRRIFVLKRLNFFHISYSFSSQIKNMEKKQRYQT